MFGLYLYINMSCFDFILAQNEVYLYVDDIIRNLLL